MSDPILALAEKRGRPFLPHQREALTDVLEQVRSGASLRLCLYHRTGAGKTYTSLAAIALAGAQEALVLCPPVTHDAWIEEGRRLGMEVFPISHALFRQAKYKVARTQPLIVDEFHLLGGHTGKGWQKLDRIARGLQAPLVIASATPNYNDAERVYCIKHVLDPHATKGGYLEFLYSECITTENPFGRTPNVERFKAFDGSAEQYLKHMPKVHYVEDEAIKQVVIGDIPIHVPLPRGFEDYGYDEREHRIMASRMGEDHTRIRLQFTLPTGEVRPEVYDEIALQVGQASTPTLIFAVHSELAEALHKSALANGTRSMLVTGKMTTATKHGAIQQFIRGEHDILIGTAALATGTDGIDKMCDHLLIVDDTQDDAQRRQLIGRILPRGEDVDVSNKVVTRLVFS